MFLFCLCVLFVFFCVDNCCSLVSVVGVCCLPCFCSFVMASAAKRVKHPPKHIRNHMQHIYKGLHKHANITLTCLHDCMSLYTYFRNHSSTTGTWPNFWQTVFNFWQLTHQGERSVAHCSLLSAVGLPHGCLVPRQEFTQLGLPHGCLVRRQGVHPKVAPERGITRQLPNAC